jgi:uncharacterized membrane protein YqaE (UPF0057 family)
MGMEESGSEEPEPREYENDCHWVGMVVLCLFCPPLAVYKEEGKCGVSVAINVGLCCLFLLPGIHNAFMHCFVWKEW